jgi:hypothetical protein
VSVNVKVKVEYGVEELPTVNFWLNLPNPSSVPLFSDVHGLVKVPTVQLSAFTFTPAAPPSTMPYGELIVNVIVASVLEIRETSTVPKFAVLGDPLEVLRL